MYACKRCGAEVPSYRGWVFKDGSHLCDGCHDELMWWFYARALMLGDLTAEIPTNKLKETT